MREFLCEAFCLIDIVEEIGLCMSPEKRKGQRMSYESHQRASVDTSLQHFASPANQRESVGIDTQLISPIPNREHHLGTTVGED